MIDDIQITSCSNCRLNFNFNAFRTPEHLHFLLLVISVLLSLNYLQSFFSSIIQTHVSAKRIKLQNFCLYCFFPICKLLNFTSHYCYFIVHVSNFLINNLPQLFHLRVLIVCLELLLPKFPKFLTDLSKNK